jgi:hypothetical protein
MSRHRIIDDALHAVSDDDALLLALHLHHPNWRRSSIIHLFFSSNWAAHGKMPGAAPSHCCTRAFH